MLTGAAVVLVIPAPVGVAAAVKVTSPRLDGLHEQVAVKVEPDPMAVLFLQPGNTIPFNLNVIFAFLFLSNKIVHSGSKFDGIITLLFLYSSSFFSSSLIIGNKFISFRIFIFLIKNNSFNSLFIFLDLINTLY
jgi:hypothetical protein